ncbi:hypothetical protein PENSUB_5031 [Penicillium subrubescens]|uniref:Uncharacterized protein n=1 Tax=Penicillium subrubescens TaxID=1316194 RepID=A0A1Q5UAV6_9EURO|nr:hypothetical protein PENSUB_5031 [Penicillium subrubescens]
MVRARCIDYIGEHSTSDEGTVKLQKFSLHNNHFTKPPAKEHDKPRIRKVFTIQKEDRSTTITLLNRSLLVNALENFQKQLLKTWEGE